MSHDNGIDNKRIFIKYSKIKLFEYEIKSRLKLSFGWF